MPRAGAQQVCTIHPGGAAAVFRWLMDADGMGFYAGEWAGPKGFHARCGGRGMPRVYPTF